MIDEKKIKEMNRIFKVLLESCKDAILCIATYSLATGYKR